METITFESQKTNPGAPAVQDLQAEEVRLKSTQVSLIDVRRANEFVGELGHIPNSQLIPLDILDSRIGDLPKDRPVVFICRSGARSATASLMAQEHGYNNTYNLAGGMVRWNALGFEIER